MIYCGRRVCCSCTGYAKLRIDQVTAQPHTTKSILTSAVVRTFCQDGLFLSFRMIITQEATFMNILAVTDISPKITVSYFQGPSPLLLFLFFYQLDKLNAERVTLAPILLSAHQLKSPKTSKSLLRL